MVGTAALPWLIGRAIDQIDAGDRHALNLLCLAVVGAGLLRLSFSVARRIISGRVSLAVEYDLRNRLYGHLQSLELGFFDRQQTGQLMSRATVDLQSIRFFLGYGLVWIAQSGLTILFAAVAMFAKDPHAGRARARPGAVRGRRRRALRAALAPGAAGGPAAHRRADRRGRGEHLGRARGQGVRRRAAPARALPARGDPRLRPGDVRHPPERLLPARSSASCRSSASPPILSSAVAASSTATLTAGDFAAFYTYLLMLIAPMRSLGIALGFAQRATASGKRLFELLDREPRLQSAPDAQPLPPGNGRVELRGVSFALRGGPPILRDIDLAVDGGTTVALVGAHGLGQVDAREPDRAPVRRHRGRRADRRRRRARDRDRLAAPRDRRRHRRPLPVQRDRARQHRLRPPGRDARGGRARRRARAGGRLHRRAARRLRHASSASAA